MFEGEVRVTPDKSTNSLLITSSARDFAAMRLVIFKLDMPRRQVFLEAVIMDLSVSDRLNLGTSWHAGARPDLGGPEPTLIAGGLNAQNSVGFPLTPDLLQGFAVGARGPGLTGTENLLGTGVSIPAFGVVLNALTTTGNTNVLATPHIIATDNVAAEINIGENIPLQDNIGGGGLAGLAGLAGGANQQGAQGLAGLAALGGLGGLGSLGFSAPRQDVGNKIKVTPHINESNQVRLEIEQESSARGSASGQLGAVTIIKRTANTTVTVDDQQTIVIGGLMRDEMITAKTKIPVLGDLPVLGFLFRRSETEKRKANLLLILTPHIIRDQADLRRIFERKIQERQEFLDRYFVFEGPDWKPPRDFSRANGLVEDIRQAYFRVEEQERLEAESQPRVRAEHVPGAPIDLPGSVRRGGGGGAAAAAAVPAQQGQPITAQPRRRRIRNEGMPVPAQPAAPAPGFPAPGAAPPVQAPVPPPPAPPPAPAPQPQGFLESPIRINPLLRHVSVDRVE
jgi:general secretion pathway protein D